MDSITKRHLTEQELSRIVCAACGDVAINGQDYNNDGWFNSIYTLSLSNGENIVVKIFPLADIPIMRYEQGIMTVEVEVMRHLHRDKIVPAPEILFHDPAGELVGSEVYVMEKLAGRSYAGRRGEFSPYQQEQIDTEMGRLCRRINDIHGSAFGYYAAGARRAATWAEGFAIFVDDLLADAHDKDVPLPMPAGDLRALMLAPEGGYDDVTTPSLVHWDLHDGNVFVDDDGRITGLLDFERAIWADPLMEFNFGAFFYRDAFNRGYGFDGLQTPQQRYRRLAYDIYLDLVMVVEAYYRCYDDPKHREWTRGMLDRDLGRLKELA